MLENEEKKEKRKNPHGSIIKDLIQNKPEASIPCESLQQLQRKQQANLVRGRGKCDPGPGMTRKMERDGKG